MQRKKKGGNEYEMSVLWSSGYAGDQIPDRRKTTTPSEEEDPAMNAGNALQPMKNVETIPLIVIKKDNNREQYDRSKIEAGVLRACYKRPVSAQQIQQTIDDIELQIFKREDKEIPSKLIGEIVMDRLKDLDPVAYVRFASVYREFKDVNTFMSELKKILE